MTAKIVAFIPVRGGSKGIPRKNIKPIGNRPLLHWTAEACIDSTYVDKVVIATDCNEIAETALKLNSPKLEIFRRKTETCTDTASTESAMLEFAEINSDFSHILLVQATSPLLTATHLNEAIKKYFDEKSDSLIALVKQLKFVWSKNDDGTVSPINYDPLKRPRRQDFDGILTEPGAFYMTTRELFLANNCRIGGKITGYELPEELYFDLDTQLDWNIVETIFKKQNRRKEL